MRRLVGLLGIAALAWGALRLLATGWSNVVAALVWMAGAVVAHDGILGMALIGIGVAVSRVVPSRVRAPVSAGLVVLGTVTATAIPVLGRFGARADNPTVLDRNYVAGWLVFAALVALTTCVVALRSSRLDIRPSPTDPR
jgi:hypothetical protein